MLIRCSSLRLSLFIYANRLASRTVTEMVCVYVRALYSPNDARNGALQRRGARASAVGLRAHRDR